MPGPAGRAAPLERQSSLRGINRKLEGREVFDFGFTCPAPFDRDPKTLPALPTSCENLLSKKAVYWRFSTVSTALHKYQLATVRYGFQREPRLSISFFVAR